MSALSPVLDRINDRKAMNRLRFTSPTAYEFFQQARAFAAASIGRSGTPPLTANAETASAGCMTDGIAWSRRRRRTHERYRISI